VAGRARNGLELGFYFRVELAREIVQQVLGAENDHVKWISDLVKHKSGQVLLLFNKFFILPLLVPLEYKALFPLN
jgi:hypothetical protein